MTTDNKHFALKEFLNLPDSGISNLASIGFFLTVDEDFGILGEIIIHDCFKQVTLNVDIAKPEDMTNALYKIDTLIAVLQEGRSGLEKIVMANLDKVAEENDLIGLAYRKGTTG